MVSATLLPFPSDRASAVEPWWSKDIGLIHFVGISTEHDFSVGSVQYTWLESDLGTVDRSITPWVVVGGLLECK